MDSEDIGYFVYPVLSDVFVGLFIHNIPAMILLVVLIISWKNELVGAITFVLAGIAHIVSSIIRADVDPWYISPFR